MCPQKAAFYAQLAAGDVRTCLRRNGWPFTDRENNVSLICGKPLCHPRQEFAPGLTLPARFGDQQCVHPQVIG